MNTGYITLARKIFNHPFWREKREFSKFEALQDLIQMVRFEEGNCTVIINGKSITYGRGQFPASLRFLAERWGWSTKKVNRVLELLQEAGTLCLEKETGQNVITLCNYDSYNNFENIKKQKRNSEETARKREGNKYNTGNTINKDNLYIGFEGLTTEEIETWQKFNAWFKSQGFNIIIQFKEQLTPDQFLKLQSTYGGKAIADILESMEDYGKKYKSVYLTANNWLKRNHKNAA